MAKKKRLRQPSTNTDKQNAKGADTAQTLATDSSQDKKPNLASSSLAISNIESPVKSSVSQPGKQLNEPIQMTSTVQGLTAKGAALENTKSDRSQDETRPTVPALSGGKGKGKDKFPGWKVETLQEHIDNVTKMQMKKIRDRRLLPRMREYLQTRKNKKIVSIPAMADHLQALYPEYGRRKKGSFIAYLNTAYSVLEKQDEKQNKTVTISDSEPDVTSEDGEGENLSEDDDFEGEELVDYKDTNAMNNMMANMYKNSPSHTSSEPPQKRGTKRPLSNPEDPRTPRPTAEESKILYPSPNALQRNINSTGLVGPRRTQFDKYFIDKTGDKLNGDFTEKGDNPEHPAESRETTIQKFLGALPSRTSYSAFVCNKADPNKGSQRLYRIFNEKKDSGEKDLHSGVTENNIGVSLSPPRSPGDRPVDPRSVKPGVKELDVISVHSEPTTGRNTPVEEEEGKRSKTPRTARKLKRSKKSDKSDAGTASSDKKGVTDGAVKEKGVAVQKSTVTFADVGGNEASLTEICRLLVHMRHPEVYEQLGVTPPRGFLLHGPPGCGKTLLANAIAGELDLPLLKLAATEIVSGVSGESEEKIRDLFDKAAQCAPCVMFIDEIDAITPKRETASKDMERRIVAQLLACMDDLNGNLSCHVLVIGATNRPDSLDPALRRAGRFDREICLGIPDEASRHRILEVLCRTLKLVDGFDFAYLARNTPGYVGADLMALTREAAMTAVNRVFQELQSKTPASTNQTQPIVNPPEMSAVSNSITDPSNRTNPDRILGLTSETNVADNNMEWTSTEISDSGGVNTANEITTEANVKVNESGDSEISNPSKSMISSIVSDAADAIVTMAETNKGEATQSENIQNGALIPAQNGANSVLGENEVNVDNLSDNLITPEDNTNEIVQNSSDILSKTSSDSARAINNENLPVSDVNIEECRTKQDNENCAQTDNAGHISSNTVTSMNLSSTVNKSQPGKHEAEYLSVLSWLKEQPPLTAEQLRDLYISMDDFQEALRYVQPSSKREGFATIPDVTWDDIGALKDVREELQLAILAPVRHPEQFKSLGLTRAQGILLAGPPGCGKTLLAKAVANESGINFISVKGPELLNMYVGESERAVRTVFQRARNSSPCVIFFDELDALCPRRSGSSEGNSSARVVNQLLTEMDGLEERKQVFIMAATNRPDIIDPAVLRPGRLDKTLYVGLPNSQDRLDILTCITKNGTKPKLADVDLAKIAEDSRCDCYTGADLAALVREASISALKAAILNQGGQPSDVILVKGEHFETAFRKIKPSVSAKDQEKYKSMKNNLVVE